MLQQGRFRTWYIDLNWYEPVYVNNWLYNCVIISNHGRSSVHGLTLRFTSLFSIKYHYDKQKEVCTLMTLPHWHSSFSLFIWIFVSQLILVWFLRSLHSNDGNLKDDSQNQQYFPLYAMDKVCFHYFTCWQCGAGIANY